MRRLTYLALAAAVCLLLDGCGRRVQYKYKIAVIPKGLTHEFWQSIERGARRAAEDLAKLGIKVEILWEGPRKESDAQEQNRIVLQMVNSRGIHGLVLAPQHSKGMIPVVEQTVEKKVPVVIIDSGLDKPQLFIKYVATNNYNGGKLAAEHLLSTLAKQGKSAPKLVLFRYQAGSESTEQREKGFIDHVNAEIAKQKAAGQPTIEIIADDVHSGPTVDSAQSAAGPLLVRIKDQADGIFAVNESATSGLLNIMRNQGLNKKILLMGFDTSEPLLNAVDAGDVIGLVSQDPYRMGYLGVWTVVRHLEGEDVSVGGKDLSTGEYVVTKENLHETSTRERFTPELQAKRTIEAPPIGKK